MITRALLGSALLVAATAASAQVAAPSIVEEDLAPEEHGPPPPPSPPPAPEPAPVAKTHPAAEEPGAGVRPIEPVRGSFLALLEAWDERRVALREQDLPRARTAERRVLELRRELGIENLFGMAETEARAAARALEARLPGEAVGRAELAVMLAPDLPDAHMALALARARTVREPGQAADAVSELGAALLAATREPYTARAFLGDALAAALGSLFATAAIVLGLLFLRRVRIVLHDARHLPLLRLLTPLQAGFLAAVALVAPLAFDLGPAAFLAGLALAASPYLARRERLVATAALAAIALLPWAADRSARIAAWTGTLADDVYRLEQGADDGRITARLEARARRGELPPIALVALGRHHKRRGDLEAALHWYDEVGATRPDALVNAGNVRLLQGRVDAAKEAYLAAADRAGGDASALAAAHYDLSKIYLRQSALDQAREARRKAAVVDPSLIDRYGSDDDFRANRWLVDVPLDLAEIRVLAADDVPRGVRDAVRARLAGPLPSPAWPWVPFGAALALWPLAMLAKRLRCARACERCGRAACTRCDAVTAELCAQCVNVFSRKGMVEARDRLRKEAEVRRHARMRRFGARALAVVGGGAGHLWGGQPVRGALVLLALLFLITAAVFWRGILPLPHPSPWAAWVRLASSAPLAVAVWVLAVRDVFRRTRR